MIAFHGFQQVPRVVVLREPDPVTGESGGWPEWTHDWVVPLREYGVLDHHLHNPFGLHTTEPGVPASDRRFRDNRAMHIDQFELSCRVTPPIPWLVDTSRFAAAVAEIHEHRGTVAAYVGSPLVVACQEAPGDVWLPTCSPGSDSIASWIRQQRAGNRCDSFFFGRCRCWSALIRFYIKPLLDAHVDKIGFDWSADFCPGDCMDRLVRSLIAAGTEVMIEPWPRNDRPYPPVSWLTREVRYWQCLLRPRSDEVPVESMTRPIYRVVPSDDAEEGREEIRQINELRAPDPPFPGTKAIVRRVLQDGHIPLVRARQLRTPVWWPMDPVEPGPQGGVR
jgi:hypothetical protein